MHRSKRRHIAQETVRIMEAGQYRNSSGQAVSIEESLGKAKANTVVYRPDDLCLEMEKSPIAPEHTIQLAVNNESSMVGAKSLLQQGAERVTVLNFASAKNPGGGFLNGSEAQEENLARSSGLYECLLEGKTYYETNRQCGTRLYTHHIIYSPAVPFFRDDDGNLESDFYNLSVITAPAPNLGAMKTNDEIEQCLPTFEERAHRVLEIARVNHERNLVLGAWGCGVFQNNPAKVAAVFYTVLNQNRYREFFERVRFSVLDRSNNGTFAAFAKEFANW